MFRSERLVNIVAVLCSFESYLLSGANSLAMFGASFSPWTLCRRLVPRLILGLRGLFNWKLAEFHPR